MKLISKLTDTKISLRNRVVMAPMNRRKATNGVPSASMITYYEQRASAGLIISDNIAVSSNGGAYMNTPAIYNKAQVKAWKKITDAIHTKGGKIFAQLVQSGRVGHPAIQNNEALVAPSAIRVNETIRTPDGSYQLMTEPIKIKTEDISYWVNVYKQAAKNAIAAGFDGVEIHGAHGFLIDEFINPQSNTRTDNYGDSKENRSRFLLEVMQEVGAEIGFDKVGIRLSPFRTIYDLKPYPEELETHQYILDELQKLDILYVHFSNDYSNGNSTITKNFLKVVRTRFHNIVIVAGGFTIATAEEILQEELVDLVAFGKLYISNPDLVERIKYQAKLTHWDVKTFYHGGDEGYIDYPNYEFENCDLS